MKPLTTNQPTFIGEIIQVNHQIKIQDLFSKQQYTLSQTNQLTELLLNTIAEFYPQQDGTAHLEKILAQPDSAQAGLYLIAAQHNLKPLFSAEVEKELEAILNNPGVDDQSLTDLTHLAFCSIDGADTRDLDQTVYIEVTAQGHIVHYALADPAFYVKPGSALFAEALLRGASYYLPGLMIPMLPRALCEDLISLNQDVERRAMVVQMYLDQTGRCLKTEVQRARICSRAKLSFEQVQAFIDNAQPPTQQPDQKIIPNAQLAESLRQLKVVGERRLRLAEQRHVVRYRRNETNIKLGDQGMTFTILDDLRNDVEGYNEQLSLLCNTEAARLLSVDIDNNNHVQAIYRIHPQPPLEHIQAFENALAALVKTQQLDPEIWLWQSTGETSLAEYLRKLPRTGTQTRIAQAIHRQAVLTNVRSVFSEQAHQHYGVGSDVYARFSAPMREIVGIFLHKELFEKLADVQPEHTHLADEALRDQVIAIANQSKEKQKQITREANRLVLDQLFQADMTHPTTQRKPRLGTVMGIDRSKIYVLLDEPAVEIKVYLHYLSEALSTELQIDQDAVALHTKHDQQVIARMGDAVSIMVNGWDKKRDRWILLIAH
jgi:ribonuclease R